MNRTKSTAKPFLTRRHHWLFVFALSIAGCAGTQPREEDSQGASKVEADLAVSQTPKPVETSSSTDKNANASVIDEVNIYFSAGVTAVDGAGQATLRRHADYLKKNPKKTLTLVAYTNDLGSRSYNLAIAEQRLLSVSKLIRSYGVSARQIRPHSVSREKIPAACKSAECWKMARRVELVYSP